MINAGDGVGANGVAVHDMVETVGCDGVTTDDGLETVGSDRVTRDDVVETSGVHGGEIGDTNDDTVDLGNVVIASFSRDRIRMTSVVGKVSTILDS